MNLREIQQKIMVLNSETSWVKGFIELSAENDVQLSADEPGQATAREVLANALIHRRTTLNAGIASVGFDELISVIEALPPEACIRNVGLIGASKRGVLYCDQDGQVLGGVVLSRNRGS